MSLHLAHCALQPAESPSAFIEHWLSNHDNVRSLWHHPYQPRRLCQPPTTNLAPIITPLSFNTPPLAAPTFLKIPLDAYVVLQSTLNAGVRNPRSRASAFSCVGARSLRFKSGAGVRFLGGVRNPLSASPSCIRDLVIAPGLIAGLTGDGNLSFTIFV